MFNDIEGNIVVDLGTGTVSSRQYNSAVAAQQCSGSTAVQWQHSRAVAAQLRRGSAAAQSHVAC